MATSVAKCVEIVRPITRQEVVDFAKISGDTNPIHMTTDQPIVHGAFLLGLVSGVVGTKCPGPGSVLLKLEAKFLKPCFADTTVKIRVEQLNDRKIVDCSFRCENAANSDMLITGTARVMKPPARD